MRKLGTAGIRRQAAALVLTVLAAAGAPALAQRPESAAGWQLGTEVQRNPDAPAAKTTVVPRAEATQPIEVAVSATLTEGGPLIEQGLVWRVFATPDGAAASPRLVDTRREASPVLRLAPGNYVLNVAFGRANLTRPLEVREGGPMSERFVLNAGGLRITAVGASGEPVPEMAVSYDLYMGETDHAGARPKIVSGARPGLIVRLNAGLYHVVSVLGDANAIVRADVTVAPGKITEAQITHHSARITFKLVARTGGEAVADTRWTVQTPQGETVVESSGALASHILAAGSYVVSARQGGRIFRREFAVEPGDPAQVELVMQ